MYQVSKRQQQETQEDLRLFTQHNHTSTMTLSLSHDALSRCKQRKQQQQQHLLTVDFFLRPPFPFVSASSREYIVH